MHCSCPYTRRLTWPPTRNSKMLSTRRECSVPEMSSSSQRATGTTCAHSPRHAQSTFGSTDRRGALAPQVWRWGGAPWEPVTVALGRYNYSKSRSTSGVPCVHACRNKIDPSPGSQTRSWSEQGCARRVLNYEPWRAPWAGCDASFFNEPYKKIIMYFMF